MDDILLTKDADALICVLYKSYLESRKNGSSKSNAMNMGGASQIQKTLMPKWSLADVETTLWELRRAGLISADGADDTVYRTVLLDKGIIYMENRFKNGLADILDYIGKFTSLLP